MSNATNNTAIILANNGGVGVMEKKFFKFFQTNALVREFVIDMSMVTYLEPPSLILLISLIDAKIKEGIKIKLNLPSERKMRDLLRWFKFPALLSSVTQQSFVKLVVDESLIYFGENPNFKQTPTNLVEGIKNWKIYAESVPFESDFEKHGALHKLRDDWSGEAMKAWLKSHLIAPANKEMLIPNRIIFECVTNSIRHSKANKLLFAAIDKTHYDEEKKKTQRFLDLCFWDNGESIISTLLQAIRSNILTVDLNKDVAHNLQSTFLVKKSVPPKRGDKLSINSDIAPSMISGDEGLITLSAFFPRYSSDPQGKNWISNPYKEETFNHPGMGLTTLLNAAIDLMEGQVSVRTEYYFINIKAVESETDPNKYKDFAESKRHSKIYQAKIQKLYTPNYKFNGNMLTVRLPLRSTENETSLSN